jgi:elongation factor 1 alpha-like protein
VTAGVKALAVSDVPLPKSKNLNVIEEYEKSKPKKHASFVVVGMSFTNRLMHTQSCSV